MTRKSTLSWFWHLSQIKGFLTLGQVKPFNIPLSNLRDAWCQRGETYPSFTKSLQQWGPYCEICVKLSQVLLIQYNFNAALFNLLVLNLTCSSTVRLKGSNQEVERWISTRSFPPLCLTGKYFHYIKQISEVTGHFWDSYFTLSIRHLEGDG